MRLDVVNCQCSFIGTPNEIPNILKALDLMAKEMDTTTNGGFDNSDGDHIDIGFAYPSGFYKVEDIKAIWREIKKANFS